MLIYSISQGKLVSKTTILEIPWRRTECFRHSRCLLWLMPFTLYFPETAVSLYGSVLSKVSKKPQWCQSKWHLWEIGLTPGQDRQSSWKPPIWLASFSSLWTIQSHMSHLWKTLYNNIFNPKLSLEHAICLWIQSCNVLTKWMHLTCVCECSSCMKQIKCGPQIQLMFLTDCAEIESTPYPDLHSHLLSFFLGIFFPDSMFALVESSLCADCLSCALCPSIS